MRNNEGFEIFSAIPLTKDIELVLGYKETSLGDQYVCWFCKEHKDYYWGKYSSTYKDCIYSLIKRLNDYYPGAPK